MSDNRWQKVNYDIQRLSFSDNDRLAIRTLCSVRTGDLYERSTNCTKSYKSRYLLKYKDAGSIKKTWFDKDCRYFRGDEPDLEYEDICWYGYSKLCDQVVSDPFNIEFSTMQKNILQEGCYKNTPLGKILDERMSRLFMRLYRSELPIYRVITYGCSLIGGSVGQAVYDLMYNLNGDLVGSNIMPLVKWTRVKAR